MTEKTSVQPERGDKPPSDRKTSRKGDNDEPENGKEKLDERLDEGLEETFPSSDPVAVKITK